MTRRAAAPPDGASAARAARAAGTAVLASGLLLAAMPGRAVGPAPGPGADLRSVGEAIYHGRAPLAGRIRGHDTSLPTAATRCVNCHLPAAAPAASPTRFGATQTFGPVLSGTALAQPTSRRGGPPTRYDAAALCTLLREGRDPALVVLPRTMPLYDATPEQCLALWTYLMTVRTP